MKKQTIRTRYYITHFGYFRLDISRIDTRFPYKEILLNLKGKHPKGMSLQDLYLSGVSKSALDTLVNEHYVTTNSKARYKPL